MNNDELNGLFGAFQTGQLSRGDFLRRALAAGLSVSSASALVAVYGDVENAAAGVGASQAKRGGIAHVSYSDASTADKQDPAKVVTSFEIFMAGMVYERLVRLDLRFKASPALARSWTSNKNASEWTFHLRRGVEWHDGRPFTSKDVAYSLRRMLNPKVGSAGQSVLAPVFSSLGISTPDKYTVKIKLKAPNVYLPQLLGGYFAWIVPNGETDFTKQIGTGPFKKKSFEAGAQFEATRNPNYWESGRPYLDGVRVSIISEQATKLQSVLSGDAHIGDAIEYSAVPQVQKSSSVTTLSAPGGNFGPLVAAAKQGPFKDPRVRKALKLSLDRKRFVDTVFFGQGAVSSDIPVAPDDPLYPSFKPFPHDPAEAKSLLKKAGYGNGLDLTLFTSQVSPGLVDTAVLYKEMASDAGIKVNVQNWPAATYYDQIWLHRPFVMSFWLRVHPSQILSQLFTTGAAWNEAQFTNPRFDRLIKQAPGVLDPAERKAIYSQALKLINDTSGELVPCHAARVWVKKKNVNGLRLDWASAGDMTNVYLT